jgi:mannose-6-phosphate isomerase-like protein (cupin superfamily)
MSILPVIKHVSEGFADGWDDPIRGKVSWHTIFSAGITPTNSLTLGVAELEPGNDALNIHRHEAAEVYFILSGHGVVHIDGKDYPVRAETALFIPGNTLHGFKNAGQTTLRILYVFAVDSFDQVIYKF